jgi:hypothetical protein
MEMYLQPGRIAAHMLWENQPAAPCIYIQKLDMVCREM